MALFNLAIDSKLRSCDLQNHKVQDISRSGCVMPRAIVTQQKTSFSPAHAVRHPISYHFYTTLVSRWVSNTSLDKTQCAYIPHIVPNIL
ncbi:putative recombinase [Vibrio azureus NBRC 104587]|uniref:Putative recombinase n=1 Tax=Vibrio azureus NBRC 104587 TaxID=1219077 RepID=U3A4R3_9VIBR|nr:putative recombinase [Vibrio azureus NBRC 104587]